MNDSEPETLRVLTREEFEDLGEKLLAVHNSFPGRQWKQALAHDAALRFRLKEYEDNCLYPHEVPLRGNMMPEPTKTAYQLEATATKRAGRLHDEVHEASALVNQEGSIVGWAPEDSIPILARALVDFANAQSSRLSAENAKLRAVIAAKDEALAKIHVSLEKCDKADPCDYDHVCRVHLIRGDLSILPDSVAHGKELIGQAAEIVRPAAEKEKP